MTTPTLSKNLRLPVLIVLLFVASFGLYITLTRKSTSGYRNIDESTALQIAEVEAKKVYGDARIEGEKPLLAALRNGQWVVSGTLHCPPMKGGDISPVLQDNKSVAAAAPQSPGSKECLGGTVEVVIAKNSGEIIRVGHYK